MTDGPPENTDAHGLIRALLTPLRKSQRVLGNIETIASSLLALERETRERLTSVDQRLGLLLAPLERLDWKVTELQRLEQAVTDQTNAIREDMNARMRAVEAEVREMHSPIERMFRDLATVVELLPDPSDGPLARLRHTFTPNGAPPQPPGRSVKRAGG